jgi:16S rRNA (uracil1498-N3)-methyltransferase
VEKLTELGVSTLHLLLTRRAVVHPRESKVDRLERYVIEASKQCGRNVLMRIEPPCEWESFVSAPGLPGMRLVAHPGQGLSSGSLHGPGTEVVAAVGPEGGFTDEEVALALRSGWQPINLGPRVLRVETAAVVLAALLGQDY